MPPDLVFFSRRVFTWCFRRFSLVPDKCFGPKVQKLVKTRVYFLRSSPFFLSFTASQADALQKLWLEPNSVIRAVALELLADLGLGNSGCFPPAIQVFEARRTKSLFGQVAKDEIAFAKRAVLAVVPVLADSEVPEEVVSRVGTQRNGYQRIEDFPGLVEVRIAACEVEKTEFDSCRKRGRYVWRCRTKSVKLASAG